MLLPRLYHGSDDISIQNEHKSFAQQLRDQRGEKLSECPWCGNTSGVYQTPQGLIDCVRCPPKMARPDIETRLNLKTLKVEEVSDQQKRRKEIEEVMKEDQRRGTPGASSSSGPSRRKPMKRGVRRVEQDSFGGAGQRDKQSTKRLTKTQNKKFSLSLSTLATLETERRYWQTIGRTGTVTTLVRSVITAKNLQGLGEVYKVEVGDPKEQLNMRFTTVELFLLEQATRDHLERYGVKVSRGEIIEGLLVKYMFDAEE